MSPDRRPYRTRDGFVCCLVYHDHHWRAFLAAIGRPELWETDPRLKDITTRTQHIDALYRFVADQMTRRTTAEWTELLAEADIPVFPVHDFESLMQDAHLADIGFFRETEHPVLGRIREMAVPSEWSGTPPVNHRPVPCLGEHTEQVLREAGYDDAAIVRLARRGAHGPSG
jgi:crotonobetainyl-CoA:carnitine CoA-transferase CaiB-like acyl-CoA transferase